MKKYSRFFRLFTQIMGFYILLSVISSVLIFAQDNIDVGAIGTIRNYSGSFYDFSEPGKLNKRVAVWGYVRNPGKYIIPINSNAADLISYAGGLQTEAYFDDLRIYRMRPDSTYTLIKFAYDDLFWKNELSKENKIRVPDLKAGDIIAVPGQPKMYFRDWFMLTLSLVSTLISLSILLFK